MWYWCDLPRLSRNKMWWPSMPQRTVNWKDVQSRLPASHQGYYNEFGIGLDLSAVLTMHAAHLLGSTHCYEEAYERFPKTGKELSHRYHHVNSYYIDIQLWQWQLTIVRFMGIQYVSKGVINTYCWIDIWEKVITCT